MNISQTLFTNTDTKLDNSQKRSRLAVTLGDPAGIGTEVVLKALADPQITQNLDITVVGSKSLLQETYLHLQRQNHQNSDLLIDPAKLTILDVPLDRSIESQIIMGSGNAASGEASFAYLETAIARTLEGKFQAIVTAPIAKSAWKAAGYDYPGQTELLAMRSHVTKFGMLFVARSPYTGWTLRTLLATTHIPLRAVADTLTPELMSLKLDLLVECLEQDFGLKTPKIAIAGLNPHSGEQGQLGREEIDWLIPWLEKERDHYPNLQLDGFIPPDTMWVKPAQAWYGNILEPKKPTIQNTADAYLALYHDQGLIPVKLMAFDQAINTSIGLPFIRTSPDHGTAFDIAGQGIANSNSMKVAIALAAELAQQRQNLPILTMQ
ncbi:4-hydroxythreonine-4-phosphate dehydrogenase [Crinalium epipsammum PCC 9333]|uniref:4-hydroxythreonine-4-phosphate dehydrogenase n=1 Tax=Crinalium epipsammum PCC 9333 TaxID=1173022 RepID=K9VZP3_9CYAN|nr:4-hydroxythreonine-4-phosphate dehydrogenase PdxA [Crinalium epipsammum]AFZ13573.1 4-hydroxythreonine-4-phosphate dehydrogenase [Crinalium epipsammum PCC 9333]